MVVRSRSLLESSGLFKAPSAQSYILKPLFCNTRCTLVQHLKQLPTEANLKETSLKKAKLQEANLQGANLQSANLNGATGLSSSQIDLAITDKQTKLPEYLEEETDEDFLLQF